FCLFLFFLLIRQPPLFTLFPYTTLFRSLHFCFGVYMKTDQLTLRKHVFWVPFAFILVIWLVYYLDWRYFLDWKSLGIVPRTFKGLRGILFSPFLHGSVQHLWNNTLALAILLPLTCY